MIIYRSYREGEDGIGESQSGAVGTTCHGRNNNIILRWQTPGQRERPSVTEERMERNVDGALTRLGRHVFHGWHFDGS